MARIGPTPWCLSLAAVAGAVLVLLLLVRVAPVAGEKVPLHMVPRPVVDAVRARFKDARISGVEKDLADRRLLYEVAIKDAGRRLDIFVTPEGVIVWIKREIAARDLPPAITSVLQDRYPGGVYPEAEEVRAIRGGQEVVAGYEVVVVTARKATLELQIGPDGRILTREWR